MNSPLNSGMYYSNNEWKFVATAGVAWERTLPSKQTLFPVWGDKEDRKPRAGIPPPEVQSSGYTLRATKGVNMHPFPSIQITKVDGTPYTAEEEVRISLVGVDKQAPPQGSCTCKGQPILGESKPFQLTKKDNEVRCKFRGGYVELKKLQVGCCTGARGHGCSFCIKVEFIREGSPLKGLVCYSLPIEVGAKGPFAKAIGNSKKNSSSNDLAEPTTPTSSENSIVVRSAKRPAMALPPYDGAEEMFALLTQLNLQQYIQNFLDNEVDLQAFLQLTDEDLNQMGITKVGPKVKILKHIQKIRDETALPAPVLDPRSDYPSLESPFTHPSILEDPTLPISEPATKKRRLATSLDNIPTPPTILLDRLATPAVDINQISLYIYLSHVRQAKDKLQKTLFMVRSKKDRQITEDIVQQIQNQVISKLKQEGKKPIFEGRAQMMLMLQGDKHGDWVARSQLNGQLWSFKKGDYIKIDNHHDVNVEIRVCQYFVGDGDNNFVEDKTNSPKKYPVLGPGACLEIGIDDNKDGRISTASNLDTDPSETFAVTHNGKLMVSYGNFQSQTCIFSFKRRKTDMKKVESLDDFQKELFLSKCLEVDSM